MKYNVLSKAVIDSSQTLIPLNFCSIWSCWSPEETGFAPFLNVPSLYTAASSLSLDQLHQHTSTPGLGNTPTRENYQFAWDKCYLFMLKCTCTKRKYIVSYTKQQSSTKDRDKAQNTSRACFTGQRCCCLHSFEINWYNRKKKTE